MAKMTLFAAIDIGSSRLCMKIFQLAKNGGISVIDSCESLLTIGKETYNYGKISYEMTGEICRCLENFKRIMRDYGVTEYICYATSAVREASNSEYIRDQIFIRTGLKVGLASNEEERFLHYKALAFNMENFDEIIAEGALFVDVSSGSVQISSYENSELKFSQNLPLGSLRLMELMSGVNNNTIEFSTLLKRYTANMLERYGNSFFANPSYKYIVLVGTQADNIKAVLNTESDEITHENLREICDELDVLGLHEFGEKYDISFEEARQLMAAVLIYHSFSKEDDKVILMPHMEFADGICIEYAEKNKLTHTKHIFTNDILSSALYDAKRYNINIKHTEAVISYASEIFNALSKKFGLSKSDLVLLKVAAIYADTGLYINVNDHNLYSYSIKKSNKLLGLSNRDNDIIAFAVLFQNGIFEHEDYKHIAKNRKLQIAKLSAILSLAQALDYEYNQNIEKISVKLRGGEMTILAHTAGDITMEKWRFDEQEEFFEEVFCIQAKLRKLGVRN